MTFATTLKTKMQSKFNDNKSRHLRKKINGTDNKEKDESVKGGFILLGPHFNYPISFIGQNGEVRRYWHDTHPYTLQFMDHVIYPEESIYHSVNQYTTITEKTTTNTIKYDEKTKSKDRNYKNKTKTKKSHGLFSKQWFINFASFWYDFIKSQFFAFLPNMIYAGLNWLFNPPPAQFKQSKDFSISANDNLKNFSFKKLFGNLLFIFIF